MKKRTLLLSALYSPFSGGAEVSARALAFRLAREGHTVRVYTARMRRSLPAYEVMDGVSVRRLGVGFPADRFLFPLLALLRSFSDPSDVVYAVMESYAGMGALFIRLVRGVPYILSLQSGTMDLAQQSLFFRFIMPLYRAMHRRAASIQAASPALLVRALRLGVPRSRVHIIPNGIDPFVFKAVPSVIRLPHRILCVARLERVKGVDVLIRAMPAISRAFSDTSCVVIGDGSCRAAYEHLAHELGVAAHVAFVGAYPPTEVAHALQQASLAIVPSLAEGFGIAVIEAMACGAVPVASDVGGIPALVRNCETGILVPPGDPTAFACAVIALLLDPASLPGLRKRCSACAAGYHWDMIARSVSALIESV